MTKMVMTVHTIPAFHQSFTSTNAPRAPHILPSRPASKSSLWGRTFPRLNPVTQPHGHHLLCTDISILGRCMRMSRRRRSRRICWGLGVGRRADSRLGGRRWIVGGEGTCLRRRWRGRSRRSGLSMLRSKEISKFHHGTDYAETDGGGWRGSPSVCARTRSERRDRPGSGEHVDLLVGNGTNSSHSGVK